MATSQTWRINPEPKTEKHRITDYVKYFERVASANEWADSESALIFPGMLEILQIGSTILDDLDAVTLKSFMAIKEAIVPQAECFREVEVQKCWSLSMKLESR